MKQIPLTQGQFTLVDDADYGWLNHYKWYAHKDHSGNFYAIRQSSKKNGERFTIHMHRVILGLERGDIRETDHQNHNTLDNRRDNLRICNHAQSQRNKKSCSNTTSRFKGVCWNKREKKWVAQICINRKREHIGYFKDEKEAARAYNSVAKKYFGKFAYLNKIS